MILYDRDHSVVLATVVQQKSKETKGQREEKKSSGEPEGQCVVEGTEY